MSTEKKIVAYVDGQPSQDPTECFAVPGSNSMIDVINPATGYMQTATNPRLERIRAAYPDMLTNRLRDLPIDGEERRQCIAYDKGHKEMGRFEVRAVDCLVEDTITWRGHYWSLFLLAEAGSALFPYAHTFGFDDPRPLSGIKRGKP
jgi:hypothetical protein